MTTPPAARRPCVRYGRSTLSHPLLVEAAEDLFVPVAIFDHRADRAVPRRSGEPSWNDPVVRIVDPEGQDLAPRLAGDHRPAALSSGRFSPSPSDDLHALGRSPLRALPLARLQATRINAALARGAPIDPWLSPRQRGLADRVRAVKDRSLPDHRHEADLRRAQAELRAVLD